MAIACAQVFYLDPASVASAAEVGVTSVDLYFSAKPSPTSNKSGIQYPGVTVQLVPTQNTVPLVPVTTPPTARVTWDNVVTSADATLPTTFRFAAPVQVPTGAEYAIVVSFDGDEDFQLWSCKTGDPVVGTSTPCPGPSSKYAVAYYTYASAAPGAVGNAALVGSSGIVTTGTPDHATDVANTDYLLASWRASASQDLKFTVRAARYSFGGDANLAAHASNATPTIAQIFSQGDSFITVDGAGNKVVPLPARRYEYVTYDRYSSDAVSVLAGERAYQNTVYYPGGTATPATLSVTTGSNTVTASSNVNWSTLLGTGSPTPEYVVIVSKDHRGPGADSVAVRRVVARVSNTVIQVDEAVPFTNTAAYFFRSPVAVVDSIVPRVRASDSPDGKRTDLLVLRDSTANSTVRFANGCVASVTITAGGSGYSNSDYLTVTGFESVSGKVLGGYAAVANLVTNSSGGITAIYLSNVGAGFTNAAAAVFAISNSSGNASVGTGANLSIVTGQWVKTEFLGTDGKGGSFANCQVVNMTPGDLAPGVVVNNPPGAFFSVAHRMPYYGVADSSTLSGRAYYCDADGAWDQYPVTPFAIHHSWELAKSRVLPSWSNEWWVPYSNGAPCGALGGSTNAASQPMTSNSSVLLVSVASNNDFTAVRASTTATTLTATKYAYNDDDTGENTDYGNAFAKGVETRLVFANNASAEDLRVFVTAWVPPGTDVRVYARLHDAADPEAFVDKDWTLLELDPLAGPVAVSSLDVSDTREMTYRLPPYPNTAVTLAGYGTTTLNQTNVVGSGTTWSTNATANLVAGDLVKVYSPLFPNNYFVVPVASVTNNTLITLSAPVANAGVAGSGMLLDKIAYKHQAFNNVLGENVARYYNGGMTAIDGFDTFQLKLVMLSSDGRLYPMIDDVRAVGVSA